jgi:hypothetical protein
MSPKSWLLASGPFCGSFIQGLNQKLEEQRAGSAELKQKISYGELCKAPNCA